MKNSVDYYRGSYRDEEAADSGVISLCTNCVEEYEEKHEVDLFYWEDSTTKLDCEHCRN